ncbi:hypothetical protein EV175_007168, partial [Coemansia sp. RSA 1933]
SSANDEGSSNSHSPSDENGSASPNSPSSGSQVVGSLRRYPGLTQETNRICLRDSQFSEEQVVRLMLQELRDRGFADTFELLQRESGHTLEDDAIAQFRANVLAGKWPDVEKAMPSIIAPSTDAEKTKH